MADKLTLKGGEDQKFAPHPEGQYAAVCVDFLDLGPKVEQYGDEPAKLTYKVALVYHTGEMNGDKPYEVSVEVTASMHEKATLRKLLEDWRGKSYTEDELRHGIPADKLAGVPCLLTVEHKKSGKGRLYAKIRGINPLPKGMPKPELPKYERAAFWEERKAEYAAGAKAFKARESEGRKEPDFSDFPAGLDGDDFEQAPF